MKRFAALSLCIVLCSALVANADIVISGARSSYDASLDRIDVSIAGISGAQAGALLQALEGTWTASAGQAMYLYSTTAWKNRTTNTIAPESPPLSYVNFDTFNNSAVSSRTGSGNLYSDFTGGWFTSDEGSKLGVGGLLAQIYITKGTFPQVTYSGKFGFNNATTLTGTFTCPPVPEPGTLALLSAGLVGLLAYAWRKRK